MLSNLSNRSLVGLFLLFLTTVFFILLIRNDEPLRGAERMPTGLLYSVWYHDVAQCAQLPELGYYDIEWYVIPDVLSFKTSIGEKVGLWERNGKYSRITIAGAYAYDEMVVKHEMLHHLLNVGGHPPLYFEDRCQLTWKTWAASHHPSMTTQETP